MLIGGVNDVGNESGGVSENDGEQGCAYHGTEIYEGVIFYHPWVESDGGKEEATFYEEGNVGNRPWVGSDGGKEEDRLCLSLVKFCEVGLVS